jgi:hypothetical protein
MLSNGKFPLEAAKDENSGGMLTITRKNKNLLNGSYSI